MILSRLAAWKAHCQMLARMLGNDFTALTTCGVQTRCVDFHICKQEARLYTTQATPST